MKSSLRALRASSSSSSTPNVFAGSDEWQAVETTSSDAYEWSEGSTYVQEPPFFVGMGPDPQPIKAISGARCLVKVGDSVTTDHISPAGSIAKDSPAGQYLISKGVPVSQFNSYGSRRGNDRVMVRGTVCEHPRQEPTRTGHRGRVDNRLDKDRQGRRFRHEYLRGSSQRRPRSDVGSGCEPARRWHTVRRPCRD